MKTIVIYASKHGTTKKVAARIQKELGNCDMVEVKKNHKIELDSYDQIVVGASIHAGQIQKSIVVFCKQNTVTLLEKPLALFLSCMDDKKAQEQFDNGFPEILRNHAFTKHIIGGEFRMNAMNFFERFIVKKIAGVTESVSNLNNSEIDIMIKELQELHHD